MDPANHVGSPIWLRNQRNSFHGVDFPYHGNLNIEQYYKRYAETLLAVDESIGRLMEYLRDRKLLESTLVIYMGDNGFAFGEHGLIDKRTAYEESMRVPMLMQCPDLFKGGSKVSQLVNIDIAPTILEAAGLKAPQGLTDKASSRWLRGSLVRGGRHCCTNTTGSATSHKLRRSTRFAAIVTNTFTIMASGTWMSCTTWKPIRWRAEISFIAQNISRPQKTSIANSLRCCRKRMDSTFRLSRQR
jgi:hypothetical protein